MLRAPISADHRDMEHNTKSESSQTSLPVSQFRRFVPDLLVVVLPPLTGFILVPPVGVGLGLPVSIVLVLLLWASREPTALGSIAKLVFTLVAVITACAAAFYTVILIWMGWSPF